MESLPPISPDPCKKTWKLIMPFSESPGSNCLYMVLHSRVLIMEESNCQLVSSLSSTPERIREWTMQCTRLRKTSSADSVSSTLPCKEITILASTLQTICQPTEPRQLLAMRCWTTLPCRCSRLKTFQSTSESQEGARIETTCFGLSGRFTGWRILHSQIPRSF